MYGTLLLLTPFISIGNNLVPMPVYYLAYLFVAFGTAGQLAYLPLSAFPLLLVSLVILYILILVVAVRLTRLINYVLYEDLAIVTNRSGHATGLLGRVPINFQGASSPFRALLKKDMVMGLRSPGKSVYWASIIVNFILAALFIIFAPIIRLILPLPEDYMDLIPALYVIILVLLVPLLAISAADPFKGEYGKNHLLRLAPLSPLHIAFIKFFFLLVTPVLVTIPFAIYFAVILGNPGLIIIGGAILPHAVLLSTAMGVGLGSRYPYVTQSQTQTPVALMITYPVLSWVVMMPVAFLVTGFLPMGIEWAIVAALFLMPYSIFLTIILMGWAAHSFLYHEQ